MWGRAHVVAVSISPLTCIPDGFEPCSCALATEARLRNRIYGMQGEGALYLEQCVFALVRCISNSVPAFVAVPISPQRRDDRGIEASLAATTAG